jgi:pyruvate/2-oxoglutarate dehydrogenase complex dihydrolipoamide acyltransferase (E2) component
MYEVLAKGLGKNVDEATVKTWFFEEGDSVSEGDDLVELATEDSVVMISVPVTGVLAEVCIDEDDTVQRDELLCIIDDEEAGLCKDGDDDEES